MSPLQQAWVLTDLITGVKTGPKQLLLSLLHHWVLTRPLRTSSILCCPGELEVVNDPYMSWFWSQSTGNVCQSRRKKKNLFHANGLDLHRVDGGCCVKRLSSRLLFLLDLFTSSALLWDIWDLAWECGPRFSRKVLLCKYILLAPLWLNLGNFSKLFRIPVLPSRLRFKTTAGNKEVIYKSE